MKNIGRVDTLDGIINTFRNKRAQAARKDEIKEEILEAEHKAETPIEDLPTIAYGFDGTVYSKEYEGYTKYLDDSKEEVICTGLTYEDINRMIEEGTVSLTKPTRQKKAAPKSRKKNSGKKKSSGKKTNGDFTE